MSQVDAALPSLSGPAVLQVVLGTQQLEFGLVRGRQWLVGTVGMVPVADASHADLQAACENLAHAGESACTAGARVSAIHVMVADSWLMTVNLPWTDAITRDAHAIRFARGQLEAAGFDVMPDDVIRLDDGPYGQPRLAVGYPRALMGALERVARAWGAPLGAVVPMSVALWDWAAAQGGADRSAPLLVWLPGGMLLLQGGSHLAEVSARHAVDLADVSGSALVMQWQRMALRNPRLEQASPLRALNLWPHPPAWPRMSATLAELIPPAASPANTITPLLNLGRRASLRRHALDAVHAGARRPSRLSQVSALLLLCVSVGLGLQAWQHWQDSQASSRAWQAEQDKLKTLQSRRAGDAKREDPARVRAVNAAIRELNMPVSDLMRALQVPRDIRVALLSVDVSSAAAGSQSGASVKIVAEARTGAEMARYVAHIADRRPIVQAYLTRHEVQESNPERPYRFTVEAAWLP